ncbi:unnamed protein product [Victoria cruziana]
MQTVLEGRVLNIWWGLRASLEVHDWRNRGFLLRPKDIFFRAIKRFINSSSFNLVILAEEMQHNVSCGYQYLVLDADFALFMAVVRRRENLES